MKWIVTILIAAVLGFGTDMLLKNSHTDFFPGYVKYKTHTTTNYGGETVQVDCREMPGYSSDGSKLLSLLAINQQKEMPDNCIEEMGLTTTGYIVYILFIAILPLLIGFLIARKVVRKK